MLETIQKYLETEKNTSHCKTRLFLKETPQNNELFHQEKTFATTSKREMLLYLRPFLLLRKYLKTFSHQSRIWKADTWEDAWNDSKLLVTFPTFCDGTN